MNGYTERIMQQNAYMIINARVPVEGKGHPDKVDVDRFESGDRQVNKDLVLSTKPKSLSFPFFFFFFLMLTLIRDENKPSTSFLLYSFPLLHNLRIKKKKLFPGYRFVRTPLIFYHRTMQKGEMHKNTISKTKPFSISFVRLGLEKRRRMANGGDRRTKKSVATPLRPRYRPMASRAKRKNNKSGSSRLLFLLCVSCVQLSVVNHLTAHFPSPEREANLFVTQKWNNHAPFNITNGSFCTSKNVYFVSRVGRGDQKKQTRTNLGTKQKQVWVMYINRWVFISFPLAVK